MPNTSDLLPQNPALFSMASTWFVDFPHCKALGIEFVRGERGKVTTCLPFATHLIGDEKARIVHGGVMTTLIDTSCGLAVFTVLDEAEMIVTLDLRIDYLRPAKPDLPIYCVAECYRLARQIAFLRATTYQDDQTQPIAHGVSTFMRTPINQGERSA